MSVRKFIDAVLEERDFRGATRNSSRSRDRDLVARLAFGRPFSPVAAAETAGKLPEPQLVEARTQELRSKYGERVDVFTEILTEALPTYDMYVIYRPLMTTAQASFAGRIPPAPNLDLETIRRRQFESKMELEWVTFNPTNLFQGKHLRFVRTNGTWYALKDEFFQDGEARLTAEMNGSVFYYRDADDGEGTHFFLCWAYQNGKWSLKPLEHKMADDDELDLSYAEFYED